MISKIVHPEENTKFQVTENTQFIALFNDYPDGKECKIELEFNTEGISAEIICLYRLPERKSLHLTTVAKHIVPHTSCNTVVRGVLESKTDSYYIGKILIKKQAQQTSSYLSDRVLVLGDGVKNNSEPILEIEADDVSASHGASTGRINPDEIYYLQSRGLNEKESSDLIVEGFFNKVLETIADPEVRELAANAVKS
ncbi:hypothetical protein C4561_02980 [candidate division WWE3 bacterium]|jgi:Fe-S cluster assembly protein SufD|uniref:SUF system FeS cluster assembly SufBD core domain-containing protein n=1 Tax=candidate division WWE3 bacterium TaxID=2053526 RepID=A0A3A4ZCZ1_UNCKA|nr:MAG: hypothetical protein C4561_02980 [candidate division WWE3 bacterium]